MRQLGHATHRYCYAHDPIERTPVTVKSLLIGAAAVAAIGAAAAGVTSLASVAPATPQVQLAVFGAPLPLDPATDAPSAGDLIGILTGLADPSVPAANKSGLVEGGIGAIEAHTLDSRLAKAQEKGQLPLSFSVANIASTGNGAASADVTASGPQMAARTLNISFVNQDGWKLSRASASTLASMLKG